MSFTGPLSRKISPKWIILFGQGLLAIGTLLLVFADTPDKYWPFVFPAFALGSAGCMLTFTHTKYVIVPLSYIGDFCSKIPRCSIAIFRTAPVAMTGTVGAIFNGALQLGGAVGSSALNSIQISVEDKHGGPTGYQGRAAGFWFLLGIIGAEALGILIFYRVQAVTPRMDEEIMVYDTKKMSEKDGNTEKNSVDGEDSLPVLQRDDFDVDSVV